jgi:acyl-coenzyme A synthetase/AMP-(fatty) acid ligase
VQQFCVEESDAALVLATPDLEERGRELAARTGRPLLVVEDSLRQLAAKQPIKLPPPHLVCDDVYEEPMPGGAEQLLVSAQPDHYYAESDAMIVFTSGTTGKPKGKLHLNISPGTSLRSCPCKSTLVTSVESMCCFCRCGVNSR